MLCQRRRRWPNIKTTFGQTSRIYREVSWLREVLYQRCTNAVSPSKISFTDPVWLRKKGTLAICSQPTWHTTLLRNVVCPVGRYLKSVSPDPGSSLFPIRSFAVKKCLPQFFSDHFFIFPNIAENLVDYSCVLAKLDYLACDIFFKLQLPLTPLTWKKNYITCQMV